MPESDWAISGGVDAVASSTSVPTTSDVTDAVDAAMGVLAIRSVTADATAGETDYTLICDPTAGNINITLHATTQGRCFCIKKVTASSNTVTLTPNSGTIDGNSTLVISANTNTILVQWDGTNYQVLTGWVS